MKNARALLRLSVTSLLRQQVPPTTNSNRKRMPVDPHITPRHVPYCPLTVAAAFEGLTDTQKLYAHHLMTAGWHGTAIVARQLSPESLPLLRFFYAVLSAVRPLSALRAKAAAAGVAAEETEKLLEYFALLYSNMGNYMSFGDSKFVPACAPETFTAVAAAAGVAAPEAAVLEAAYSRDDSALRLGFPPEGQTAYYSGGVTAAEAAIANEYLASKRRMEAVNTRVVKEADGRLVILVASAAQAGAASEEEEEFKEHRFVLRYGDHAAELARVAAAITAARPYAANETQARMLDHYAAHFTTGDVEAHKASQREWVLDAGPAVETNIGFIETYRDPSGVRAEWEGFVAVVNAEQSRCYGALVAAAETFIARLPWGAAYEKDTFTNPDFTSLEVLGFASSGIPAGICIPNYDDIRQDVGFKNVYLANVVSAVNFNDRLRHVSAADWALYKRRYAAAMSVNVGIHELLGHGTGKLMSEREDGSFNFDRATLTDPLAGGAPVDSWYKPGETFSRLFGGISNSYEECRAEAVALFLCGQPDLLALFGLEAAEDQEETAYVCWLNMVRAGLVGLEFYSPETRQWRQAHMRARFAILQTLLRGSDPLVTITATEGNGDNKDEDDDGLVITLDRARIATDGVARIGELLLNLSVNKSLASVARGTAYYEDLTAVDATFEGYRAIVLERARPRKQYVQPHTFLRDDGSVGVREFEGSVDGVVESFVTRHAQIPL